ncbi:unnamed protein product [Enterobius vermicularis]|uniref:DDE_Tnp_1_7 domain-containing protein n=1 Tax=Enterobius vermicularis TaxID=51028 RepID=A0A0N4V1M4_ENTVE|nr:unnamed protein product [Enterobius vermicularis]
MLEEVLKHHTSVALGSALKDEKIPQAYNVVAQIDRNRISDPRTATFRRYRSLLQSNECSYSIATPDEKRDNIVFFGRENQTSALGYDYMVAMVSRRTSETKYLPVKVVSFEKVYTNEPNILLGLKPPPKIIYNDDKVVTKLSWAERRRALTEEFGSAKKLKSQAGAGRRLIGEDALKIMLKNTNIISSADSEEKPSPIALFEKPQSSVLPIPNNDAKSPADVYSYNQFLSDEEINGLREIAFNFLGKSERELINAGFPKLVLLLSKDSSDPSRRAVFLVLLATMITCYKMLSPPRKRSVTVKEWFSLPFPQEFLTVVREMFFANSFSHESARRNVGQEKAIVNTVDKDKLLAHTICLGLIIDGKYTVPVTPWTLELSCSDKKFKKMALALGCTVIPVSESEGIRLGTLNVAKLVGPPNQKSTQRRPQRR